MTDLRELLDSAAGDPTAPTPDEVSSDVRRGQQALHRRRGLGTLAGGLALVAAVAVGVVVVPNLGGSDPGVQVVAPAGDGSANLNAGVDLVPWDAGPTPKPISPAVVPDGWTIFGNETALVISAPGATTSPNDFEGKLVAMLSPDTTAAPVTRDVTVNGIQGTLSVEGKTTILLYPLADQRLVTIQAPSSLHWDDATLVRFAEGLTISADAPAGRG
jgi:hypothetical protein